MIQLGYPVGIRDTGLDKEQAHEVIQDVYKTHESNRIATGRKHCDEFKQY